MKTINKFYIFFLLTIIGCGSAPIKKAFKGEFEEIKNNSIIYEYCQGCHNHKELIPELHVAEKTTLYQKDKYRKTKECRTCHYIQKDFFVSEKRKTIRPRKQK
jgi:nitrate/TMAO reductase-like tetraheme cytochrome c subunit